jgi:hypothetical protein
MNIYTSSFLLRVTRIDTLFYYITWGEYYAEYSFVSMSNVTNAGIWASHNITYIYEWYRLAEVEIHRSLNWYKDR